MRNGSDGLTSKQIRWLSELFEKIASMHGVWLPTWGLGRYLPQDVAPGRALTTRRQAEDFHVLWECPHMKLPKRRLRSIVAEVAEFIIHRQSDSSALCGVLKDPQIAEQASAIGDRPPSVNSSNSE
jgi:hypothetical protein